ncbi:MFS general substrate transporter [Athelia psychrophila]|uniref:MFS general substrate transporter n=1 Tax=Athelia psychrophila TaxID=1759441 RepID=A0A166D1H6_9AGAM|nr:MFS general substrate transporter [Fibularhizoctonia sp. CBS 109695]
MSRTRVLSTAFNFKVPPILSSIGRQRANEQLERNNGNEAGSSVTMVDPLVEDEMKLPRLTSLVIVLLTSGLLQVSFFIIVSSSNEYATHLGGGSTFSGLVIGIPTVFSGLALLPMMKIDQGLYKRPLHFACGSALLGNALYALAYQTNFLYLILIGRIVSGFGFTFWMYSKKYCSDPRIVGVGRRTTLASYLVIGQGCGFALGPFIGGLLYKVGFASGLFNGYTSPAWLMTGVWAVWWLVAGLLYKDEAPPSSNTIELTPTTTTAPSTPEPVFRPTVRQYLVIATICWVAMMCFFILGAWEANIPVYGHSSPAFDWSPFAAGNFIALGGGIAFPFLFANLYLARRFQDRYVLALGTSLGTIGLLVMLALLKTENVNYGGFIVCWFMVALGFNIASTCTISLLSKQLPGSWNKRISLAIQYSNYLGRVAGATWGGAGLQVGMLNYVGVELLIAGIGITLFTVLWKDLKAKTG